jgi:serine/threonine-protein kinase
MRKLPEPGDVVAGKYRFVRRLGAGGMGVVYEAEHTRMQQRVAIKMLLPEILDRPDVVSRFQREARAAGKLKSENTARVLDVDVTEDGVPYMIMEFLEGSDLGGILDRQKTLPIADAVDFVLQTCHAMAEAHAKGVIHRDLKPSNLFVTGEGAARRLKVLDFGISKVENDEDAHVTATQAVIGTPLYMSPEQIRSAKHVDARTDIWSLGVILYELLAGRTPFEGSATAAAASICIDEAPPLAQFRPDVPPGLTHAIDGALKKNANDRFQTVQDLAAAIAPFGSGAVSAVTGVTGNRPITPTPRSEIESAPTLPHVPADGATVPDPSMPSSSSARRTGFFVALGVTGMVLTFAVTLAVRSKRSHPIEREPIATASARAASSDTTTATTLEPLTSESVGETPSATSQPRRAHASGSAHPHAAASTVRAPAPAPTRL